MNILVLRSFEDDFKKLPRDIQKQTLEKLVFLKDNRGHPSLRTKKMKGYERIWEGSISMSYRLTYHIEKDNIVLRRIGAHTILKDQ